MIIRPCEESDLNTLCAIEKACFKSHQWNYKQFQYELLENQFANIFVIEEGKVFGFIDFWILFEKGEIARIAIIPQLQNKGIGNILLNDALKRMIEQNVISFSLEVRVSNEAAIRLYEKNGFSKKLIKKGYYQDGEDAYLMLKEIGEING